MKKGIIDQIQRRVIIERPDTFYAERLQLFLATTSLKREVMRGLEPVFMKIIDGLAFIIKKFNKLTNQ